MELTNQMKRYRTELNLSQEVLAEKLYVSRQTISNWETGKSYPDIHSLLLMSSVFDVSLDQLIKGDVKQMREVIRSEDIRRYNRWSYLFTVMMGLTLISAAPLYFFLGKWGLVIFAGVFLAAFIVAGKVEKLKKEFDIQTYKEILAFVNGEALDEIAKHREEGKRPYQTLVFAVGAAALGFFLTVGMLKLLSMIF